MGGDELERDVRGTHSWYKKSKGRSNFEAFQGELAIQANKARLPEDKLAFPTAPSPTTTPA